MACWLAERRIRRVERGVRRGLSTAGNRLWFVNCSTCRGVGITVSTLEESSPLGHPPSQPHQSGHFSGDCAAFASVPYTLSNTRLLFCSKARGGVNSMRRSLILRSIWFLCALSCAGGPPGHVQRVCRVHGRRRLPEAGVLAFGGVGRGEAEWLARSPLLERSGRRFRGARPRENGLDRLYPSRRAAAQGARDDAREPGKFL